MEIKLVDRPKKELIDFFDKRIEEFNVVRWEVKEKKAIAITVTDHRGNIVAGAAGKSFGLWLLLDNLWVSEQLRGQEGLSDSR